MDYNCFQWPGQTEKPLVLRSSHDGRGGCRQGVGVSASVLGSPSHDSAQKRGRRDQNEGRDLGPPRACARLRKHRSGCAKTDDHSDRCAMGARHPPCDSSRQVPARESGRHSPDDADDREREILDLMGIPAAHSEHRERRRGEDNVARYDSGDTPQHCRKRARFLESVRRAPCRRRPSS